MPIAENVSPRAILALDVKCPNPECGHITTTSGYVKKGNWINCSRCHIAIKIPDFNQMIARSASQSIQKKAEREH